MLLAKLYAHWPQVRRKVPLKRLTALAGLALALAILQGLPGTAQAATVSVSINAAAPYRFSPGVLTVNAGDTVHWTTSGTAPHTITSDGCGNPAAGPCTLDSGGSDNPIRGGTPKSTYDFKFDQPGVYPYYCRVHGAPGGIGEYGVVVVQAAGQPAPQVQPRAAAAYRPPISFIVYSPREGETISGSNVPVRLGINGATVRAAVPGITDAKNGHYHLFLDTNVDLTTEVNVGGINLTTNTTTLDSVASGPHTLTVVWTYDNNISPLPPFVTTVRFSTTAAPAPAAPAITPPNTGDGGLKTAGGAMVNLELPLLLAVVVAGAGYLTRSKLAVRLLSASVPRRPFGGNKSQG